MAGARAEESDHGRGAFALCAKGVRFQAGMDGPLPDIAIWRTAGGLRPMGECRCPPEIVVRAQPPGASFYGYRVSVTARIHRGACPLSDEVLAVAARPEKDVDA